MPFDQLDLHVAEVLRDRAEQVEVTCTDGTETCSGWDLEEPKTLAVGELRLSGWTPLTSLTVVVLDAVGEPLHREELTLKPAAHPADECRESITTTAEIG